MRAIILLLILFADVRSAEACTCDRQAPCEAYWESDLVFVGTVTSQSSARFRTETVNGKKVTIVEATTLATLDVVESFRGTAGKTVDVETGDCGGVAWRTGKRFIVYARREGARVVSPACSRTSEVDDADEDLAYARSKPETATLGFVQGIVSRTSQDDRRGNRPVANALVKVRGHTKAVTQTDAHGAFKILVPPGDHQLDILAPGLRVHGPPPLAKIAARGACAIVEPTLIAVGVARGRLVDHEGKPAANIPVVARNVTHSWHRSTTTEADGRFEIVDIPLQMSFALSVAAKDDGGPTPDLPIPTRFYPAASSEAAAKFVTMPATGLADKLDFALPSPLRVLVSTGTVTRHGKPVTEATVIASAGTARLRVFTDKLGRFTIRHFPGKVTFEACAYRNGRTACRSVVRKLDAAGKVDIAMP